MNSNINHKEIVDFYNEKHFELEQFLVSVKAFFSGNPKLNTGTTPVVHSVKSRFKDADHLVDKLQRKFPDSDEVTTENIFEKINDLIGVRVLHLYQDQFKLIHDEIMGKISVGDWALVEDPKAYTWDPESTKIFNSLNIKTEVKDTFYTSVHYVIKPNNSNPKSVCCEVQVRTLFEEIWGEIDHGINYPHPSEDLACIEQLRVLAKLVSTGTRLADSIFRTYNHGKLKKSE